jgi:hypothetical protein
MSEASTMAAPAARAAADAVLVALRRRPELAIVFARHRDPVQGGPGSRVAHHARWGRYGPCLRMTALIPVTASSLLQGRGNAVAGSSCPGGNSGCPRRAGLPRHRRLRIEKLLHQAGHNRRRTRLLQIVSGLDGDKAGVADARRK